MPKSAIHISLEGLSDLLFLKHKIQVNDITVDPDTKVATITIEGDDVPDSERTYVEYIAVYGTKLTETFTGDVSDLVREVRLNRVQGSRL